MKAVLDASVVIDYLRTGRIKKIEKMEFVISSVTVAELYSGKSAQKGGKQRELLDRFLGGVSIRIVELEMARLAGEIKCMYDLTLGDAFVAALALEERLPLAALDKKAFAKIDGLKLLSQNWGMIVVQELRNGTAFLLDGQPFVCLKYEHIKMGRGSATIRIKAKNLLTGATTEKSFINSARVEEINTTRRPMNYSYQDGVNFVFLDPNTYEQSSMTEEELGENAKYLKENLAVNIFFWEDKPLWVELPPKLAFKISETDPGTKGNSVSNLYKDAVLENGMRTRVPLFVQEGESVLIDTRDGSYSERVK